MFNSNRIGAVRTAIVKGRSTAVFVIATISGAGGLVPPFFG